MGEEGCRQACGHGCRREPGGGPRLAVPAASSCREDAPTKEQVPAEGGRWLRLMSIAGGPRIHAHFSISFIAPA